MPMYIFRLSVKWFHVCKSDTTYRRSELAVIIGDMFQASSGCDCDMEGSLTKEQNRPRNHHAVFGRGPGGAVRRRGTPIPVLPPRVPTPVPTSDTR